MVSLIVAKALSADRRLESVFLCFQFGNRLVKQPWVLHLLIALTAPIWLVSTASAQSPGDTVYVSVGTTGCGTIPWHITGYSGQDVCDGVYGVDQASQAYCSIPGTVSAANFDSMSLQCTLPCINQAGGNCTASVTESVTTVPATPKDRCPGS